MAPELAEGGEDEDDPGGERARIEFASELVDPVEFRCGITLHPPPEE